MLAKLETKSNRVKGLSFHPNRPWILASLHNGTIQLWDYRIRTLLEKFEEHDGPVRGICFHNSQPLFVTGGDDYKIKVWNYKQRRCLFTLLGHLDYIRTVQFHHEHPWIVSASDDQTIRIWNWQARACLAVLTGHNHYVMCACFHPRDEDLVASASLDQTVRVWTVRGLRKKHVGSSTASGFQPQIPHFDEPHVKLPQSSELFGSPDASVSMILEGHDRGVNWVSFHPTGPLLVTGADDRVVKLWRMNDNKAWEVDTFRGHFNNVSCVIFHPRQELIISNSEDKTVRVWDMNKRTAVHTFRRESDRFWILAAHPSLNLLAAGHDSGLMVFKLERERPPYHFSPQTQLLHYLKDRYIRRCHIKSGKDTPLLSIKSPVSSRSSLNSKPSALHYSPHDNAILLWYPQEGGHYELYSSSSSSSDSHDYGDESDEESEDLPGDSFLARQKKRWKEKQRAEKLNQEWGEPKRGLGGPVCFMGRKRFAVLDKPHMQIIIRNLDNTETKKCPLPISADNMFAGPSGYLVLSSEDRVIIIDVQQRRTVAETNFSNLRHIFWSNDQYEMIALVSSYTITLANRKLDTFCTVKETVRIKSAAWDSKGVFLYTTHTHIKYCLVNGDYGAVRTLSSPQYLVTVVDNQAHCLDREYQNRVIAMDTTEYLFKLALHRREFGTVLRMVKEYNLIGDAIVNYLQRKGYPEVALHFVRDPSSRFELALECGNIQVALDSAKKIDNPECWEKLAAEALRQGNIPIVEMSYSRIQSPSRLTFLHLLTGNLVELSKSLKLATHQYNIAGSTVNPENDHLISRFSTALLLGDVSERIKALVDANLIALAYQTAVTHGLNSVAESLEPRLPPDWKEEEGSDQPLISPPRPVLSCNDKWPSLIVSQGYFETALQEEVGTAVAGQDMLESIDDSAPLGGGDWGDGALLDEEEGLDSGWGMDEEKEGSEKEEEEGEGEGEGWGTMDMDDLEPGEFGIEDVNDLGEALAPTLPPPGRSLNDDWSDSPLAVDSVCGGNFLRAMQLLNQQVGVTNFDPLKPLFISLRDGSSISLPGPIIHSPSIELPLCMIDDNDAHSFEEAHSLPHRGGFAPLPWSLDSLIHKSLKLAYEDTNRGKFSSALSRFRSIIHSLLFTVVDSRKEETQAFDLLKSCKEYVIGLLIELHRRELAEKPEPTDGGARQAELALYFTHCKLQSQHLMLTFPSAIKLSMQIKNYVTARSAAVRFLEMEPKKQIADQIRKRVALCERNLSDSKKLRYQERNPFEVCTLDFLPIYRGEQSVSCPVCHSSFLPKNQGTLCPVCLLAPVQPPQPHHSLLLRPNRNPRR